jgi:hypothetical protein
MFRAQLRTTMRRHQQRDQGTVAVPLRSSVGATDASSR